MWVRGDIVELLISKGADVNSRDSSGNTPLYKGKLKINKLNDKNSKFLTSNQSNQVFWFLFPFQKNSKI